jgi:hypothetical protein
MSTQDSKTEQEVISLLTFYGDSPLQEEIKIFLLEKGYSIELDSDEVKAETPRLLMFIKKSI